MRSQGRLLGGARDRFLQRISLIGGINVIRLFYLKDEIFAWWQEIQGDQKAKVKLRTINSEIVVVVLNEIFVFFVYFLCPVDPV